jgi:CBS domain-containing protein
LRRRFRPMRAKEIMTRMPVTTDKSERLDHVLETMKKHRVSKLVVVERGAVVGLLVDGDIADELGAIKNRGVPASHLHVSSAMRKRFQTLSPEADGIQVRQILLDDDAGLIPVVHDDTCVGVITCSDVLHLVDSPKPIEEVMTDRLHVVSPGDRVIHARRMMVDHRVERLPVLEGGKLVGIVGEMDVALGLARFKDTVADKHQPAALQRFLVEDIMTRTVTTAGPETSLTDAARLMKREDVGCLPVLRGDRCVGIVTRSDLLPFAKV